jgi:hypothetical protein
MAKFVTMEFCELPATPYGFDRKKFEDGDSSQALLYKKGKIPNQKKKLSYSEATSETKPVNYARFVPEGCCYIDFDNPEEAEQMKEIIIHSGLRCLILKTQHGYHFLFRTPEFYKKEMTGATNWFGYKFDTKQAGAVQIIKVCGMERDEITSWSHDLVAPAELDIELLDVLPFWLWGNKELKDLYKDGKPGDSEYSLTNTPFTQLMVMKEGRSS